MGATEGVGSLASTVGESTGGAAPVDGAAFTGGDVLVIRHVLVKAKVTTGMRCRGGGVRAGIRRMGDAEVELTGVLQAGGTGFLETSWDGTLVIAFDFQVKRAQPTVASRAAARGRRNTRPHITDKRVLAFERKVIELLQVVVRGALVGREDDCFFEHLG